MSDIASSIPRGDPRAFEYPSSDAKPVAETPALRPAAGRGDGAAASLPPLAAQGVLRHRPRS